MDHDTPVSAPGLHPTPAHAAPAPSDPQVVELRQYTLRASRRDALIDLFDREFVVTQEAVGPVQTLRLARTARSALHA